MRLRTICNSIERRQLLKSILAATAGLGATKFVDLLPLSSSSAAQNGAMQDVSMRFGIVTDSHSADFKSSGSRRYTESLGKMTECVEVMNDHEDVKFLIELGDFVDGNSPTPLDCIEKIEDVFTDFKGPQYHVLGNHCHDDFSKDQFLGHIDNTGFDPAPGHYSVNHGGIHFVALDANYRSDGEPYDSGNFNWRDANIPEAQIDWLRDDLDNAGLPAIIFLHQCLDGSGAHYVENAAEVRKVLEEYGKTLAVFQGHNHAGDYKRIEGIHYYTLKAMVEGSGEENNSYALVEVKPDYIAVKGYRRAASRDMGLSGTD